MAKATMYRVNQLSANNEKIGSSDVGISLPVLRRYLEDNGIYYYRRDSLMQLSKGRMETLARSFTVSIMCQQKSTIVDVQNLSKEGVK
jgi:hypothetical protein